jgi:hypothetical protein
MAQPDTLALHPCEPKISSSPRDQVISADSAVGTRLSSDAVPLKIDRFGPRAAQETLEPPPVRDKNGLSRLRTVNGPGIPKLGHGQRWRSQVFDVACSDVAGGLVQSVLPPSPCKQTGCASWRTP